MRSQCAELHGETVYGTEMNPSLSIGPRTLLNDCNHSATAIFWRSAIEGSHSQSVFVSVSRDKIRGSAIQSFYKEVEGFELEEPRERTLIRTVHHGFYSRLLQEKS